VDVNGAFLIDGDLTVVSQRNSFMLEMPGGSSAQRSVMFRTNLNLSAGTLFHVETTGGETLFTFEPDHNYSAVLFSSVDLTSGTTYRDYTGGSCSGTEQDGLYTGGTYSGGTLRTTFTSSGTVQTVNF
jgi:trimeric autotransporter adhesin